MMLTFIAYIVLRFLINSTQCYNIHNNNASSGLYEGDIQCLSNETIYDRLKKENEYKKYGDIKFVALRGKDYRWKEGLVPYIFHSTYPPDLRFKVEQTMEVFHNKTCVKFTPRNTETDYIEIFDFVDECFSNVGHQGGKQNVSLPRKCCSTNIILHELMHSLGFFHEHNRADRDDYIILNWANIPDHQQFDINNLSHITHYNTRYDYASVMHYEPIMEGRIILTPKFRGEVIRANGLSTIDIYEINTHYRCDDTELPVTESKIYPPTLHVATRTTEQTTTSSKKAENATILAVWYMAITNIGFTV